MVRTTPIQRSSRDTVDPEGAETLADLDLPRTDHPEKPDTCRRPLEVAREKAPAVTSAEWSLLFEHYGLGPAGDAGDLWPNTTRRSIVSAYCDLLDYLGIDRHDESNRGKAHAFIRSAAWLIERERRRLVYRRKLTKSDNIKQAKGFREWAEEGQKWINQRLGRQTKAQIEHPRGGVSRWFSRFVEGLLGQFSPLRALDLVLEQMVIRAERVEAADVDGKKRSSDGHKRFAAKAMALYSQHVTGPEITTDRKAFARTLLRTIGKDVTESYFNSYYNNAEAELGEPESYWSDTVDDGAISSALHFLQSGEWKM